MNYRDLNPHLRQALNAQQREADEQAAVWVQREVREAMLAAYMASEPDRARMRITNRTYDRRFAR